ncbi:unnamed protein product [Camellia sinensis]
MLGRRKVGYVRKRYEQTTSVYEPIKPERWVSLLVLSSCRETLIDLHSDWKNEYERIHKEHIEKQSAGRKLGLAATETLHQEREERHRRLKREFPDKGPMHVVQSSTRNSGFQMRNHRAFDQNSLPPEYKDLPAFLFGESMGGAATMLMYFQSEPSTKNLLVRGCASFFCFGRAAAGLESPSPFKVGPAQQQDILPAPPVTDKGKAHIHTTDLVEDDSNTGKLAFKSNLKKPTNTIPVSGGVVSECEVLCENGRDIPGHMERRKVQWTAASGGEIAQIREFELSDVGGSDDEFDNGDERHCSCRIMRWLDCPAYGNEIGGIIPSKVPLGESFNEYIHPEKRYSSRQVIHQQRQLGREVSIDLMEFFKHLLIKHPQISLLGLVIDLTNTSRYYLESDWIGKGIEYVKIKCQGRDSVPDNASVDKFVYEVLQFRSQQMHVNKIILVHCTHGHNRTGYMIVHFLVRTESISVTEAIEKFSRARHPGIYKRDYIDGLYSFHNEQKPEFVVCPQTPEWKRSSDLDINHRSVPDQDDDGASILHENLVRNEVMTNDDVLGDSIPFEKLQTMRQFCYQALKLNLRARGNTQFPGDNLQLLRQRYYYATWKADGTRYMMLITWDGCYVIDRNFCFRKVELRFPCKSTNKGIFEKTHHYTLLDGEMVIDIEPKTQKQERRYLIYDLIAINQVFIMESGSRPFSERWTILENEVIKPRNSERDFLYKSRNPYYRYDLESFRVRRKDFYLLSTVTKLLKEFIPRLSHAADGLIFQGWDDPYVPRTHEGLLKWKYPEMNSVDFLYEFVAVDNRQLLFLNERGKKKLMEGNRVVFKDASAISSYSGKIIECSWDAEEGVWVCMRIRPDKSTPNEFNTYKKVMRSIKDNITEEVLFNEIREIIRLPMYADRIQNDCRAFTSAARRR